MASPTSPSSDTHIPIAMAKRRANASLYQSSPSRNTSSSADVCLPDSSDEFSDRVPLLSSSVVGSTPYPFKFLKSKNGEDPLDTPSHTESSGGDRSFPTPSTEPHSNSSASMEIFLGPQPMSYVYHRHRLMNEDDFERSPGRPAVGQYHSATKSKGIAIVPAEHSHAQHTYKEDDLDTNLVPVSRWRQEQVKKFKPSRPINGARERPIPLLHGPLSLPYARNPSGVDATVADQSSHMSHVFGLRSANSADTGRQTKFGVPGARIVSDPTNARSTSGSSYLSAETHNLSSSVGDHNRPMVVRDFNQLIGIKKSPQFEVPADAAQPCSRSYGHLGLGKPLSTIPGSPTKQPTETVIYDEAIHSASSAPWLGEDKLGHAFASLALVDPVTNSIYNVRVPRSSQTGTQGGVPCEIIPLGSKMNLPSASSKADSSKNWRSKSSGSQHHVVFDESPKAVPPPPSTPAILPADHHSRGDVLTVNSLYEKFATLKHHAATETKATSASSKKTEAKHTVATKGESPANPLGESTGRKVNVIATDKPASASAATKKKGRTASNSKPRSTSSPHPYHPSNRAKGTPGAGMHLKRVPTDAEATPSKAQNPA